VYRPIYLLIPPHYAPNRLYFSQATHADGGPLGTAQMAEGCRQPFGLVALFAAHPARDLVHAHVAEEAPNQPRMRALTRWMA
jgi:hypothetical protein